MTTIHEQLAPRIKALGIKETARRVDIDPGQLSKWVSQAEGTTGKPRQLTEHTLEQIAAVLGGELVFKQRHKPKRETPREPNRDKTEAVVKLLAKGLTPKEVAEQAGCSIGFVYKVRRGDYR